MLNSRKVSTHWPMFLLTWEKSPRWRFHVVVLHIPAENEINICLIDCVMAASTANGRISLLSVV